MPYISMISDQTTDENVSVSDIYFMIWDAETPSAYLNLSVSSSNPTVISNRNIRIDGTDYYRSIRLTPNTNQFGESTITLTVSDGILATSISFELFVDPVDPSPAPPAPPSLPRGFMGLTLLTNQTALLQFQGDAGSIYNIEASSDFSSWSAIATAATDCDGSFSFIDNDAPFEISRYYRISLNSAPPQ